MAKAQFIARFAVDVAPSQLSPILRRRRALRPMVLDTIAEDEKEAAAVELSCSSYALLRAKAPRQNLSYTATEVGKSSAHGERFTVAGKATPCRTPGSWLSSPSRRKAPGGRASK